MGTRLQHGICDNGKGRMEMVADYEGIYSMGRDDRVKKSYRMNKSYSMGSYNSWMGKVAECGQGYGMGRDSR